jgi:hypothetical protein
MSPRSGQPLQRLLDGIRCADVEKVGARPNAGRRRLGDPVVNAIERVGRRVWHWVPFLTEDYI